MKILKPGDTCPCCGQPIPESVSGKGLLILGYVAEGMALMDAIAAVELNKGGPSHGAE